MKPGQFQQRKIIVYTMMILFVFASGFIVYSLISQETTANAELESVNQIVDASKTAIAIDKERRAQITKIISIISRYNKTMTDSAKQAIANEIYLMSQKYKNINVDFICATITHESGKTWDPKVVSRVGALGLMQIMPTTGAFLAAEEGIDWTSPQKVLFDPITNIRLGCRYLSNLVALYEKDGGLAAYNGGPKRAEMWLASKRNNKILYRETREYVPAVLKLYQEFRSEVFL